MGADILATDLFVHTGFASPGDAEVAIKKDITPGLEKLAGYLLSHDCVYIPVRDYLNVAVIAQMITPYRLNHLLDSQAIKFCRFDRLQSFCPLRQDITDPGSFGNIIAVNEDRSRKWPTLEQSAEILSRVLYRVCDDTVSPKQVIASTIEVDQGDTTVRVARMVEQAVRESCEIQGWLASARDFSNVMRSTKYDGSSRHALTSDRSTWAKSPWARILLIYHAQLDLYLQNQLGVRDLSPGIDIALPYAVGQGGKGSVKEVFSKLTHVMSVPDFGAAFRQDVAFLDTVILLRNSRGAQDFRDWLGNVGASDEISVEQEFVDLLMSDPIIESLPLRSLRFVTSGVIDLFTTGLPLVAAIDSFLLGRFCGPRGARVFVENMRKKI